MLSFSTPTANLDTAILIKIEMRPHYYLPIYMYITYRLPIVTVWGIFSSGLPAQIAVVLHLQPQQLHAGRHSIIVLVLVLFCGSHVLVMTTYCFRSVRYITGQSRSCRVTL